MGWLDSNFTYKSGDKPKYKVGDNAYRIRIIMPTLNTKKQKFSIKYEIIKVSNEKSGFIFKEFTYTIKALDNGEVISFVDGVLSEERESVKSGDIFIDGSSIGVVDNEVIAERTNLAEEGVIFIHIALDMRLRQLQGEISVSTKGFTHAFTNEELTNIISGLVEKMISNYFNKRHGI